MKLLASCLLVVLLWTAAAGAGSPPPGTVIKSKAAVFAHDPNGNLLPSTPGSVASANTVVTTGPLLRILKLGSTDPVEMGAQLVYTINYQNTGNVATSSVTVKDTLSAYLAFESASDNGQFVADPAGGGVVTWNLGTLNAKDGGVVTITARVKTPADYPPGDPNVIGPGTQIPNTVRIDSPDGSHSASITSTVGQGPNLALVKSGLASSVPPGGTLTYALQYQNSGNQPATNVIIRDQLPSGTSLQPGSITGDGVLVGRTVIWNTGTVPVAGSGAVGFQVVVSNAAQDGDQISNVATMTSNELAPVVSNTFVNTVFSAGTAPAMTVFKNGTPNPVYAKNNIVYTISVSNDGTTDFNGVTIRDTIPAKTTFVSASDGGTLSGDTVVWSLPLVAAGTVKTVTLSVLVDTDVTPGTHILNKASVIVGTTIRETPIVTTLVRARTVGEITFYDTSWNPAVSYKIGDTMCLQVDDADRNTDPALAEAVKLILTHADSGDLESVTLTETHVDTGIFQNCIPTTGAPAVANDGQLSVTQDSVVKATYVDIDDETPINVAAVLIDPFGTVFDSVSGAPVAGTVVTLYWEQAPGNDIPADQHPLWPAGQANPVTTGADGKYQFPLVPPGTYFLDVVPSTVHTFPSVVPDATLPPGFTIGVGSRGERFTLSVGDPPLHLDLPADPPVGSLQATKTAGTSGAAIGDVVRYEIVISNNGVSPVDALRILDTLPPGFNYVTGSSRLNGTLVADPTAAGTRTLAWPVGTVAVGSAVTLQYVTTIGATAAMGDNTNIAYADGVSVGVPVTSNQATATISINEGVFTSRGLIIGKVFLDANGDGIQNGAAVLMENDAEGNSPVESSTEPGIAGVVLFLDDGTRVITDQHGKYSIPEVAAGARVLRLDEASLPPVLVPVPVSNRFLGQGNSQFVTIDRGGMVKANFALRRSIPDPGSGGNLSANGAAAKPGLQDPATGQSEAALEDQIADMTPDLDFIFPVDGGRIPDDVTDIVVKYPLGASVAVYLNDEQVDDARIGRRIEDPRRRIAIHEYISVPIDETGEITLTARMKDPFGNDRGEKQITVHTAGHAVDIAILPDVASVPADGNSTIAVTLKLLDKESRVVPFNGLVSLSVSAGSFAQADADPGRKGFQVKCSDGVAVARIQAPRESGAAWIRAAANGIRSEEEIFFSPHLRDMIVVGSGEIVVGHGSVDGDTRYLKGRSGMEDGTFATGRGAVFAKGRVLNDMLLTAAYDSAKEETDELFRQSETDPDAEDKYPLYGDESEVGFEAKSKTKLYVKLEKDKSSALYGDYNTDLNDAKLSAYRRSFNGVKVDYDKDDYGFKAYGSYTDQTQVVDTLPGRGVSGYYYLSRQPVINGSEKIVIETRDRYRTDHVLKRESKARGTDYEIDYDHGTVLFKAPIPGRDASFNPVYIVVSYESRAPGDRYYLYGGRGFFQPRDDTVIGVTAIHEDKEAEDYSLIGADATVHLPWQTILTAEYAQTESLFTLNNMYTPQSDNAWLVDIQSAPLDALKLNGYYQQAGDYFDNPSAVDVFRGSRNYGFGANYAFNPETSAYATYIDETDTLNDMDYSRAVIGGEHRYKKGRIFSDLSHETSTSQFVKPTSPTSRYPFDNSEEKLPDVTSITLGGDYSVLENLSLTAGHRQDVSSSDFRRTQAGLRYRYNPDTSFYLREELSKYEDREEARTVAGVETEVAANTVAFNEYRLEDGASGSRNQNVIGLKNRFQFGEAITGNLAVEHFRNVSGTRRSSEPDSFAIAGGVEYLPLEGFKLTSRLEYRNEVDAATKDTYLAELGMAFKLNDVYTLLGRERLFVDDIRNDGSHITNRVFLGLAYRPRHTDAFNALAKVEYKHEKDAQGSTGFRSDSLIPAIEGIYQAGAGTQLTGRYAGKWVVDDAYQLYTDLVSFRVLHDLGDRFDVGAECRALNQHGYSLHLGGTAEIGYRLIQNLWLSAGYTFDDFETDLTGDSFRGEGPFMKLRFKFDEQIIDAIKNPNR